MDLSILIFLVVTAGLLGVFHFAPRYMQANRAKVRKRLAEEFGLPENAKVSSSLFKDLDASSLAPAQEYALLSGGRSSPGSSASLRKWFEAQFREAHLPVSAGQLYRLSAVLALGLGLTGAWFFGWGGALVGCLAGAAAPLGFVCYRRSVRCQRFLRQLPGAFELMARVIRSGQSVPQAFQAVAEAFEDPLAGEFANCRDQQNLGLRPEVVFQEMANRSGILELRIFVMAMTIQQQTGGNLSEVLDRLATLIRSRLRLRQQVRTLTAEGRLQGLTLVVLPVVMFVAMFFLNRQYAQVLLDHAALLWATAALMGVGLLWIRNIVNIRG